MTGETAGAAEAAYWTLTALMVVAAAVGLLAVRLRQPLIVSFIFVGILVGPAGLNWVQPEGQISALAQVGVTVLLFTVGLKLDIQLVQRLGKVALATGIGQLTFTIAFGFLIALALGMTWVPGLYVAVALTFSSTIIIVKLLSDKRELDSLHGRIAMGFLIVQDIAVVVAMMVLGTTGEGTGNGWLVTLGAVALKVGLALALVAALMRWVLPPLMRQIARSQELLLLSAIAWGTLWAALGEHVGFSKEVGAFLAGFSLASSGYREALSTRLTSVRDFLLLFFFIELGAMLDLSLLGDELLAALVLSAFVLVGNPLIVLAIMGWLGYRRRTGFLAGLTVAQISEFSIIFVAMGLALGHVERDTLALVTLVGLITITLSTYMILYSHRLYEWLDPWLVVFERHHPHAEPTGTGDDADPTPQPDVIVYGLGRYGGRLAMQLQQAGVRVLGVDFDPGVLDAHRREGLSVRYGDAEDPDFPETLPLAGAAWVIGALPLTEANLTLLRCLQAHGFGGSVAVVSRHRDEDDMLRSHGALRILHPFEDAADAAARVFEDLGEARP
jgi:Kef-type K+ transport system membrane component KefB